MQTIVFIILIGLAGGAAVAIQGPLASMITQRLGLLESIFIIHIDGALAVLVPLLMYGGGYLAHWKSLPWYALGAGVLGLIVLGAVSYTIPRIGVATSVMLIVAGELLVGAILDQFGLLGVTVRSLSPAWVGGLIMVLVGVWLAMK